MQTRKRRLKKAVDACCLSSGHSLHRLIAAPSPGARHMWAVRAPVLPSRRQGGAARPMSRCEDATRQRARNTDVFLSEYLGSQPFSFVASAPELLCVPLLRSQRHAGCFLETLRRFPDMNSGIDPLILTRGSPGACSRELRFVALILLGAMSGARSKREREDGEGFEERAQASHGRSLRLAAHIQHEPHVSQSCVFSQLRVEAWGEA